MKNKYYLAVLTAFSLWGFFSLVLKPISYVPSFDILFFRLIFSAILLILFIGLFRRKILIKDVKTYKNLSVAQRNQTLKLTFSGAVFLGVNWFLFIYVVNHVNVQSASFAYLICPLTTVFLAKMIFKDHTSKIQNIALLLSLLGCGLYFVSQNSSFVLAFVVAVTYSLYIISQKNNQVFDRLNTLALQFLFVSLLVLPYYLFRGVHVPQEFSFYLDVSIIASMFTILPLYLNLYALKGIKTSTLGVLIYLNPLLTFLVAIFYFKESINMFQIASYLVILLSVILFNYQFFIKTNHKE